RGPLLPCCAITEPRPSYITLSASGVIRSAISLRTESSNPGGPGASVSSFSSEMSLSSVGGADFGGICAWAKPANKHKHRKKLSLMSMGFLTCVRIVCECERLITLTAKLSRGMKIALAALLHKFRLFAFRPWIVVQAELHSVRNRRMIIEKKDSHWI